MKRVLRVYGRKEPLVLFGRANVVVAAAVPLVLRLIRFSTAAQKSTKML